MIRRADKYLGGTTMPLRPGSYGLTSGSTGAHFTEADLGLSQDAYHQQLVDNAQARLSQSSTGAKIVASLKAHNVRINVLASADFYAHYTDGRGGFFDAPSQSITIPDGDILNADDGAILIAHEGTHAVDNFQHHGVVGGIGSMMLGMATGILAAPFQLHNPASAAVDALRLNATNEEVTAYMAQATVEDELHAHATRVADFGHDASGAIRTPDETRKAVASDGLYQLRGKPRLVMTAAAGSLISVCAVDAAEFGVRKLTDKAIPAWAKWGAMGALAGAMVLEDYLQHRDT